MRYTEDGELIVGCTIVADTGGGAGGGGGGGDGGFLGSIFGTSPSDRASARAARARAESIRQLTLAIRAEASRQQAIARDAERGRRAQQEIQTASMQPNPYDLEHQIAAANENRLPIGGSFIVEQPAPTDVLATLIGATKKKLKKSPYKAQAIAEFGSVKKAAQALKFYEPAGPTQLTLAGYGVIRPLVRGSRDDPAGALRPPRFYWPGSLVT